MSSWSTGTNVIKEVDQNKNLTLQMLELKKQGGGTEYFVRKNDVKLGTKSVTQNGTYTAAADNKYGFSQFSVNVRGAAGSSNGIGKPSGSDVTTTKPGGGLDLDGVTLPGGSGSSVVGTDPTTGNDYAVGVDEDGQLVNTPVPSGIKIVTPPTKTAYTYQENMDYTGIVVAAKKKDGTTFTDARYTNGHIPMGELIFPVEKAPAGSGDEREIEINPNQTLVCAYTTSAMATFRGSTRFGVTSISHPVFAVWIGDNVAGGGWYAPYLASTTPFSITGVDVSGNGYTANSVPYTGPNGESWFIDPLDGGGGGNIDITNFSVPTVKWGTYSPTGEVYLASNTTFANLVLPHASSAGGTVAIPVKWLNPYTGDTHQDTFQITSTPSTGSSSTTTGSSGTEGSGGGGTF